jgi:hypothetical protein
MDNEPNPYAPPLTGVERMAGPVPRASYPWWVKLSMWGVPGRAGLWAFVALSVALAGGCVVYGFWEKRFFLGIGFLLSALMYWLSIRWVDRHGSWTADA